MVRAVCWLMTSLTAAVFPEGDAVGVGDFADQARRDADAVVGKDGVGGDLLLKRDFDRAQRHGQIGGNVGGDAEAVAVSMTLWMPTRAASLSAGMLRDSAKALATVMAPL
jgi:hypothetical protein